MDIQSHFYFMLKLPVYLAIIKQHKDKFYWKEMFDYRSELGFPTLTHTIFFATVLDI